MSKSNRNWLNEVSSAFKTIRSNGGEYASYGKLPMSEVGKKFKNGVIGDYIAGRTNGHSSQIARAMMHMFGMDVDKANGKVRVSVKSKASLERLLSQVEPVMPFVSKRFLIRLSGGLNDAAISGGLSEIDTISRISENEKLTDYLMKFVSDQQLNRSSVTTSEADEFVRPSKAKRSIKRRVREGGEGDDSTQCADSEGVKLISALKVENQKLRKQIERSNVSGGNDQLLIERIEDAIKNVGDGMYFTKKPWNGGSTFRKNEHGTAVLHLSDWHIGSKENVNGFNAFDYGVACERVKTLANKYIDWTKMHRSLYNIDELVVIATGDMISGDIHDELIRTNEFSVPEQCVRASTLFAKLINELSGFFKKVRVEYIVADNHSRTTAKIEFGDGTNSYNYIVGYMSMLRLERNKSVEFNLYPEIQKVIKVENLKYLITHGNCVRGGFAGIPFYSMQRKVGAEAAIRMNMPQDYHFDKIVMGHYHVPMRSTQYEMTGCLSSTTMFDHSAGRHCRACQTAWIVSKDNELDYFEIWLS